MSDTPTSLFSRVMTYPIYILPGHRFPRIDVRDAIAKSDLPAPAQQLITDVVRRTRLWKGEKGEVALELIAHFRDGLEAGPSADELISSFGSIKTAALLIRRGKRRNRPLWWHARRRFLQAVGAVLLVYIGLALLLVVRHPNPSIDYLAELNRPVLATPLADRAWPIYRAAWIKARIWESKDDDALYVNDQKGEPGRFLRPGDARWPETVAFLKQQKPLLDAMRDGGLKPSLGWELKHGDLDVLSPEDRTVFRGNADLNSRPVPTVRADRLVAQSLISVLLPYLAPLRFTASILAADMRLAASEGDTGRVLADYRALAGIARQCGQSPIIVEQMVGLGILSLGDKTIMDVNQHMPGSLSLCRVDLLHVMASAAPTWKMAISGDRTMLLDIVQRVYSDNGKGDGSPTLDGLQVMTQMSAWTGSSDGIRKVSVAESVLLPATAAVMASRKDVTEQADRLYSLAEEDAARPLWVKLRSPGKADALIRQWKTSTLGNIRYALPTMLAPFPERRIHITFDGIPFDVDRALHEAAMVALVLEAYRDKAGQYPATLADLVPHYLPTMPLDYSTGGPLRYKLIDGKPLLYGLGKDGVDDGGVWTDKKIHYWQSQVPDTGDWVLYPPIETE